MKSEMRKYLVQDSRDYDEKGMTGAREVTSSTAKGAATEVYSKTLHGMDIGSMTIDELHELEIDYVVLGFDGYSLVRCWTVFGQEDHAEQMPWPLGDAAEALGILRLL